MSMSNWTIQAIRTVDARYPLPPGAGTDAVHSGAKYGMALTRLLTDQQQSGTGLALTLDAGNNLVCEAIELLAAPLIGAGIEDVMSDFGSISRNIANHPALRWLGPHKGVVHLALASITNAC